MTEDRKTEDKTEEQLALLNKGVRGAPLFPANPLRKEDLQLGRVQVKVPG